MAADQTPLAGKVAIVTGAGRHRGIGRYIATLWAVASASALVALSLASSTAASTPLLGLPNAPTDLHEVGPIPRLEWTDNSDNEDGFRLMRQVGSAEPVVAATYPANTTTSPVLTGSFEDLCRSPILWVIAFNEVGVSAPSNLYHASPPPGGCRATVTQMFANDSGHRADELVIGQVHGLEEVRLGANAPGCDRPAIGVAGEQIVLTWASACVDPGECVDLELDIVGPWHVVTGVWTARALVTATAPSPTGPAPSPSPAVGALPRAGGPPVPAQDFSLLGMAVALALLGTALVISRRRDA